MATRKPSRCPSRRTSPAAALVLAAGVLASLVLPAPAALAQDDGVACRGRDYFGQVDLSVGTSDMEIMGNTAYLAAGEDGLYIADVTDPRHPVVLGSLDTPGVARNVAVVGTTAYLACDNGGVFIIDASNPSDPFVINSFKFSPTSWDIQVLDGIAYVATFYDGLQIVDVSNPYLPRLRSEEARFTATFGVEVEGGLAVVEGGSRDGVRLIDVSDPYAPVVLGAYGDGIHTRSVTLRDSVLFFSHEDGVDIVDISTPSSPVLLATQPVPETSDAGSVTLVDDLAYVSNGVHGILAMNIADLMHPLVLGWFDTPGGAGDIGIIGSTAVGTGAGSLYSIDISRPRSSVIASLEIPSGASAMARTGDHLYIAGSAGMEVVDISDPFVPLSLGVFRTPAFAGDIAIDGTIAYLTVGSSRVVVVDISNPAQPQPLGEYDRFRGNIHGIAIVGSTAVVATSPLTLLDVSEPSTPTLLSTFEMPGIIEDVTIHGTFACVANHEEGLRILDISDPDTPREVSLTPTDTRVEHVEVFDDIAYVSSDSLLMYDIGNPANPVFLNSYSHNFGNNSDIEVQGEHMYFTDIGLQMVNIAGLRDSRDPVWIGSQTGIGDRAVVIDGDLAYVAGPNTLSVIDLRDCACPADLNHDGTRDTRDYLAFLNAWVAGDSQADWNSDGTIDAQDVAVFQQEWAIGCG